MDKDILSYATKTNKSIKLFTTETHGYMYNGIEYYELDGSTVMKIVDRDYVYAKAMLAGVDAMREMEQGEQIYSKYPNYLKRKIRQFTFDLDEHDISRDIEIEQMSPMAFFEAVCQYEGLLGSYYNTITSWIHDIFEVDLNEIER